MTAASPLRWRLTHDQAATVDAMLLRTREDDVAARLAARDDTLWGSSDQAEIANRLGWLDAPEHGRREQTALERLAADVIADGYTDILLLGMGGSSLAPEVIGHVAPPGETGDGGRFPRLRMLDSTDPDAIATVDAATDAERTLTIVSTKSGGTLETLSLLWHFWDRHPEGSAFVAITDPGSDLEEIAKRLGFRTIVHGDPEIGGRYSALSPFGLVPAALLGVSLDALLRGGEDALAASRAPLDDNAPVRLGAAIAALAISGRDKLVVRVQDPRLGYFGLWMEQLVAESTGKHARGVLPIVDDPGADSNGLITVGTDRQLLVLRNREPDEQLDAAIQIAERAGVPVLELLLDAVEDDVTAQLGYAFATCEVAVAVTGWALGINPFDQPDVQAAKDATKAVLVGLADGTPIPPAAEADADLLRDFVDGLAPPGYLAVLAYLPPSNQAAAAVGRLRRALSAHTAAAITAGFGPRYLHSTGQMHKGGPANGRYLILEHDPRASRRIPEGLSEHPADDFATLFRAQAEGDRRTLAAHHRPALRLDLGTDWLERIDELVEAIEKKDH